MPCTGSNTDTNSCQGNIRDQSSTLCVIRHISRFQLKDHGIVGALGVPVLLHVITQELGVDQEHILATCHVLAVKLKQVVVRVIEEITTSMWFVINHRSLLLAEGSWAVWNAWGACSGTCDSSATQSRTRSFDSGTMPCTGSGSDVGTCSGVTNMHLKI